MTRPSGKAYAQVSYDPLSGRTTSVTDDNGGTWQLNAPTVGGSSQPYVASVLGNEPLDYWRLGDSGTSDAVNQVVGGTATYNNVTEGVTGGQFADTTMDSFNGTTSDLVLPSPGRRGTGTRPSPSGSRRRRPAGVLFSSSAATLPTVDARHDYAPSLYVGIDGHLYGEFWDGKVATPVKSTAVVDDGKWHNVVLAARGRSQVLYVDGAANGHPVRQRHGLRRTGSAQRLRRRRVHRRRLAGRVALREERATPGTPVTSPVDLGDVSLLPRAADRGPGERRVERVEELGGLDPDGDRDRHRPRRQHADRGSMTC